MNKLEATAIEEKIKNILGLNHQNELPNTLTYDQVVTLFNYDADKDTATVFPKFLQDETLNGKILALREGVHVFYHPCRDIVEFVKPLDTEEALTLELELEQDKRNRHKRDLPPPVNEVERREISLFAIAKVLKGTELMEHNRKKKIAPTPRAALVYSSFIYIYWHYKPKDLKEWLDNVGVRSTTGVLNGWLCLIGSSQAESGTNNVTRIGFDICQCLPNFPKKDTAGSQAIYDTCKAYTDEHGICPTAKQILYRLINNPPKGYKVDCLILKDDKFETVTTNIDVEKLDSIRIDGAAIKIRTFLRRCNNYMCSPKLENCGE